MDIEELKKCIGMKIEDRIIIGRDPYGPKAEYSDCVIKAIMTGSVLSEVLVYSRNASESQSGHNGNIRDNMRCIGKAEEDQFGHWWIDSIEVTSIVLDVSGITRKILAEEAKIAQSQYIINGLRDKLRELVPEEVKPAIRHLDLED